MNNYDGLYSIEDAASLLGTDKRRLCNFLQLKSILHTKDGQYFVNKKEAKLNRFINVPIRKGGPDERNSIFMTNRGWKYIKRMAQEELKKYIKTAEDANGVTGTDTDIMKFINEQQSMQTAKAMMS